MGRKESSLSQNFKMKLFLTEKELMNVVTGQSLEEIEQSSKGAYGKWNVKKVYEPEEGYALEFLYDEKGELKSKFAKGDKSE